MNQIMPNKFFFFNEPYSKTPLKPERMHYTVVHKSDTMYPFLHDTMVYSFHNRLFIAWYNSTSGEIKGKTIIRGRYSDDSGRTWSEPFVILESDTKEKIHYVPVMFYEHNDTLYANITIMKKHDTPIGYVVMKYESGTVWKKNYSTNTLMLFNTNAKVLANGCLASGGRVSPKPGKHPFIPCIAIAQESSNKLIWTFSPMIEEKYCQKYRFKYPETDFISWQTELYAISRNDRGSPLSFYSNNYGQTWEFTGYVDISIRNSKMCCGTLTNGVAYLIYNDASAPNRTRLLLAISRPGEKGFHRLYLIADGLMDNFECGDSVHYPCAIEYNQSLFISCTLSRGMGKIRHAILFIVPIASING